MDTRDDRTTARSGAEEKEEGTAPQEKGRGRNAPAKKAPGRGETALRIPQRNEEGGKGRGKERDGHPTGRGERSAQGAQAARGPRTPSHAPRGAGSKTWYESTRRHRG